MTLKPRVVRNGLGVGGRSEIYIQWALHNGDTTANNPIFHLPSFLISFVTLFFSERYNELLFSTRKAYV